LGSCMFFAVVIYGEKAIAVISGLTDFASFDLANPLLYCSPLTYLCFDFAINAYTCAFPSFPKAIHAPKFKRPPMVDGKRTAEVAAVAA